jgi:membrane-associated phospholipid phosphatase
MFAEAGAGERSNNASRFFALIRQSTAQLIRPPSHSRRAEAARRAARQILLLTAILSAAVVVLMYAVDVPEIILMPPRGTPDLWPVHILTAFGKAAGVLWLLAGMLLAVAVLSLRRRGISQAQLLGFGLRLEFIFFAVLVPILFGEVVKWIVGRGRPFVGGKANAFNFEHFAGTEAYASFPSAHSITAFALAFAIAAVWPRARVAMAVYAVLIAASRLVLLAHHPSDVVAGALVGMVGAMLVQYWFAARHLAFAIRGNGTIVPLAGPSFGRLKRVAREAAAP